MKTSPVLLGNIAKNIAMQQKWYEDAKVEFHRNNIGQSDPSRKSTMKTILREQRENEKFNYRSEFGRSTVDIKCPFCNTTVRAFIWSLAGGGKRCSNKGCNTLHTTTLSIRRTKVDSPVA